MKLQMKAKIASIHDKIDITDENGNKLYHIQSKVLSIHNVTYLTRASGEEIAKISRKVVSLHDTHFIEMAGGPTIELQSELFHITKDVMNIDALGWQLLGDVVQHNYRLMDQQGHLLAETHKKWITLHNTYEIEIVDEAQMDLIVAVLVTMDKIITDRQMTMSEPSQGSYSQN